MWAFYPAARVLLALASIPGAAAQTYTYTFASATAAGVDGTIKVKYAGSGATTKNATITADLDFTNVVLADLTAAQAACTVLPTEYAWHIHVKWPSTEGTPASAAYVQCSKDVAGNHYDPLLACGTNSEYAGLTNCTSKTGLYSCTPAGYTANPTVCEKGDLSGKLGKLSVNATSKKATGTWTDLNYPLLSENTAQWNIILHAVCDTQTPRVACAAGKFVAAATTDTTPTTSSVTPAPTPSTTTSAAAGVFNGVVVPTSLLVLLATLL